MSKEDFKTRIKELSKLVENTLNHNKDYNGNEEIEKSLQEIRDSIDLIETDVKELERESKFWRDKK